MKRKAWHAALFIFFVSVAHAQNPKVIDSLLYGLQKRANNNDTVKVNMLNNLAFQYYKLKPDSALLLSQQAYAVSQTLHFKKGEGMALMSQAISFAQLGDFSRAIDYAEQARAIFISIKQYDLLSRVINNIGFVYFEREDYQAALQITKEALQLKEEHHTGNAADVAIYMLNLGECYLHLNKLDSAETCINQGTLAIPENAPELTYYAYYLTGDLYMARNQIPLAKKFYYQSVKLAVESGDYGEAYETYYRLANLFKKINQADSSIYFAKLALENTNKALYNAGKLKASQLLSNLYEGKDNAAALQYYKIFTATKDSVFGQEKMKQFLSLTFEQKQKQRDLESAKTEYQNKIRYYILFGLLLIFAITAILLLRSNALKQKAKTNIEKAYAELKTTQVQLIQAEKMASLGELTAGIAHEIQNPLNFINNFSELNKEIIADLKTEIDNKNYGEVKLIANDIETNEEKINHHGKRADAIVKSMLQHSRTSSGQKEPTDINALCDEYLRLAYHGLRAKDKSFNAILKTNFDGSIGKINIVPQDIGRVLLNLFNNAFYAVNEKWKAEDIADRAEGNAYKPAVSVVTQKIKGMVEIVVKDNGAGIPQNIVDKIFQPFFTTKPTGEGTGLGLSLAYDIVKSHGGTLAVVTQPGDGTAFSIRLLI